MRAIVMHEFGGPDVLLLEEVQQPQPAAGEVRVRVGATFVAKTKDVATRTGKHPYSREMRLPHVLGGEHAGIVDAVGGGVSGDLVGARVAVSCHLPCGQCPPCRAGRDEACNNLSILGIHRDGAYAEFCVVPAINVHRLPDDVNFEQAAALAANGGVATAQLDAGGVGQGDWVAVLGATGALGSVDIGLSARRGAHVIALVRDLATSALMESLGAEAVVDVNRADLADELLRRTGGAGVDVMVDNLAIAEHFTRYMAALASPGCVVLSGAIGSQPLPVDARSLYIKSNSIIGIRTGNHAKIAAFWEAVRAGYRLSEDLILRFPFEGVADAHIARAKGKTGHVVLCLS